FEYQQAVPFFSLFMATLRADPPVGDADAMRRLGVSADLRYWVVHELADAIHAAAAETPLVIVLEDVHWVDNGTLLALRSLATARPDAAVLWVLTVRTGAGGPALQETLSVLARTPRLFGLLRCRRTRLPTWSATRCGRERMSPCSIWPPRRTAIRSW